MGPLSVAKALALLPLLAILVHSEDTKGTSGTCSKDSKCVTGCCSKAGYCGFGPDFCGDDVCISDCDAQAECGRKHNSQERDPGDCQRNANIAYCLS